MERRSFVAGAFGLVSLVALGASGLGEVGRGQEDVATTVAKDPAAARGPVMAAGIELVPAGDTVQGWYKQTHLFDVDAIGAELVRLADGSLSIDELASAGSVELNPADVATFFLTLGQKGYLANTVLVNLTESVA